MLNFIDQGYIMAYISKFPFVFNQDHLMNETLLWKPAFGVNPKDASGAPITGGVSTFPVRDYIDKNLGYVVASTLNVPPLNGEVDPTVTNICLWSDDLSNAAWTKNRVTVSKPGTDIDPLGGLNAWRILEDTATNTRVLLQTSVVLSNAQDYCWTAYLEKGNLSGGKEVALLQLVGAMTTISLSFDLILGKVTTTAGGPKVFIKKVVVGGYTWWKLTIRGTTTSAATTQMRISPNNGASYVGDGTSYMRYFGGQMEAASVPHAHVPSTGSNGVKAFDDFRFANAANAYVGTTGSVVVSYRPRRKGTSITNIKYLFDASVDANNLFRLSFDPTSDGYRFEVSNAGVSQVDLNGAYSQPNNDSLDVILVTWKANEVTMYINGIQVAQDTSCTIPTPSTTLFIGNGFVPATANSADGRIMYLGTFSTCLSSTEAIAASVLVRNEVAGEDPDLMFWAPFETNTTPSYFNIEATHPDTEVVDALGTYLSPVTGKIEQAVANIGSITAKGVLCELTGANICWYSGDLSNAQWVADAGIVVSDDTVGVPTCLNLSPAAKTWKLLNSGLFASQAVKQDLVTRLTAVRGCAAVLVAWNGTQYSSFDIGIYDDAGAAYRARCTFTWDVDGVLTAGTPSAGTADAEYVTTISGVRYYWATVKAVSGITAANNHKLHIFPTSSGSNAGFQDVIAADVSISAFRTAYVPTPGAASVSAAFDAFSYRNTDNEAGPQGVEGALICAVTPMLNGSENAGSQGDLLMLGTSLTAQALLFTTTGAGIYAAYIGPAAGNTGNTGAASGVAMQKGVTAVLAMTWKLNELKLYIDGVLKATDTTVDVPVIASNLWVGGANTSATSANSKIKHAKVFKRCLTAAEITYQTQKIQTAMGLI